MGWVHIDTGKRRAEANMALDEALLSDLQQDENPVLHLYGWEHEAATYGYFIDPENFLNIAGVKSHHLDLAKRPTGGGIIFHNCDFAFSVLVPASHPSFSQNPLQNYAFVNNRVIWAIGQMHDLSPQLLPKEPRALDTHCRSFCMAKPTKYDVMIEGRKAGGAAQRKTRHGFLHQGSISLGLLPESYLRAVLVPETQVVEGMKENSYALLGDVWTKAQLEEARAELAHHLKRAFSEEYDR